MGTGIQSENVKRDESPQGGYPLTTASFSIITSIDVVKLGASGWTNHSLNFGLSPAVPTSTSAVAPGHVKLYGFRSGRRFFLTQFMFTTPYDAPAFEWNEVIDLIQIYGAQYLPSGTTQGANLTYAYVVTPGGGAL